MFKEGKMYSGETANKMVQHMVSNYKGRIQNLHNRNVQLQQENKAIRAEMNDLVVSITQLKQQNEMLLHKMAESRSNCSDFELKSLQSKIKALESANSHLRAENLQLMAENNALRLDVEFFSKTKKDERKETPWAIKETISSYELNYNTEIRFDYCMLPDGTEYIDARKYVNGYPTKKGICLSVFDFDTFLRYGRTAWSRVTSGLFNTKRWRK